MGRKGALLGVWVSGLAFCALAAPGVASAAPDSCNRTAARAVEKKFGKYFFNNGERIREVSGVYCERKMSRRGVFYRACDLNAASPDESWGDVDFVVIQNDECTRVFAAYIDSQE